MAIDAEHLRQHYASLSDEELAGLDRNDLTAVAQKCYDLAFCTPEACKDGSQG